MYSLKLVDASNSTIVADVQSIPGNKTSQVFIKNLIPGATYLLLANYSINYVDGETAQFVDTLRKYPISFSSNLKPLEFSFIRVVSNVVGFSISTN